MFAPLSDFLKPRFVLALLSSLVLACGPAASHDSVLGDLMIHHPWARATVASAKTGAVYLRIENLGEKADRLIGAQTEIAEKAEIHLVSMENDVMQMTPTTALDIPAGGWTELAPMSHHLMLFGLKHPLAESTSFPLSLTFEQAGTINVEVQVQGLSDLKPQD